MTDEEQAMTENEHLGRAQGRVRRIDPQPGEMATINPANTNRVEAEALGDHHPTLHTTGLDVVAELASQQSYLLAPAPEPPAPGLLLLAKAAVLMLRRDSRDDTTTGTKTTMNNNTAAVGTTTMSDDSAEEVIEVRPLKRAKTSASCMVNGPAPGSWKKSTKSSSAAQRKIKNKKTIPKRASQVSAPAFQLPFPSLYKGAPLEEGDENEDEEDSRLLEGRGLGGAKRKRK